MTAKLVGLVGPIGSGKSTVAEYLSIMRDWRREKMAGPLKSMLASLGLSKAEIEGDLKESPCELLCGMTPRHAMQTLGTEWGRALIGPDIWIRAMERRLDRITALDPSARVVIDDVRFPNEFALVRRKGGEIWRVRGRGAESNLSHASEAHWKHVPADVEIDNSGTTEALYAAVEMELRR